MRRPGSPVLGEYFSSVMAFCCKLHLKKLNRHSGSAIQATHRNVRGRKIYIIRNDIFRVCLHPILFKSFSLLLISRIASGYMRTKLLLLFFLQSWPREIIAEVLQKAEIRKDVSCINTTFRRFPLFNNAAVVSVLHQFPFFILPQLHTTCHGLCRPLCIYYWWVIVICCSVCDLFCEKGSHP